MRVPLVPYDDSDEDDDNDAQAQKGNAPSTSLPSRSVYTSLGVKRASPQKGDWVCSVHVALSECEKVMDILDQAVTLLRTKSEMNVEAAERSALHVSLSRPIVLRASERATLLDAAGAAVRSYVKASPQASRPSPIRLSFARFALLPSEQADRLYFVAEIGQGWDQLRRLTDCVDRSLTESRIGRPYHEDARFHASFASVNADDGTAAKTYVDKLNERLGKKLRAAGELITSSIHVTMGSQTSTIPLCI